MELFDLEWLHAQVGQAWATVHTATSKTAVQLCSAYLDVTVYCLDLRLHPREKIAWLEAAVRAARQLGGKKAEGAHLGTLGRAYADLGQVEADGEHPGSIDHYQQALAILEGIKSPTAERVRHWLAEL